MNSNGLQVLSASCERGGRSLFAPTSFSNAWVNKINRDVLSVLTDAEFRAREIEGKSYDFAGLGPDAFKKYIRQESQSRKQTLKASGATLE